MVRSCLPRVEKEAPHLTQAKDIELPVKRTTGDTLRDRMTENAYERILPARYLQQDEDGDTTESQEELFERVAKNVALAEAVYAAERADTVVRVKPQDVKPGHSDRESLVREVFGKNVSLDDDTSVVLTEENVNKFSYDTVVPGLEGEVREAVEDTREEFQSLMEHLAFVPNSPTLMNAGGELQQLSACFVDSPTDDMQDIHETAKEAAQVFQSGGGMGYAFWLLRPYGDPVGSTGGIASGPITFMRTFDQMCETIAQGGTRRGAQMGVMRVSHPDVIQFIHAKNKDVSLAHALRFNDPDDYTHTSFNEALDEARELIDEEGRVPEHLRNAAEGHLSNFNISVGVTDDFMEALKEDAEFTFTNPRTGEPHVATRHTKELYDRFDLGDHVEVGEQLSVPAREIWKRIVAGAHENGEPGVIFLDRVNHEHSFDVDEHPDHEILATNPCGEQPLEEYEACNLGHINLSTLASQDAPDWRAWNADATGDLETQVEEFLDQAMDWEEFDHRIEWGTRFLENVVTMSDFPIDEIEQKVSEMRKIGLGIMGLAQLYVQLGVRYGSEPANEIARQLMTYINHGSKRASHELAGERGSFDEWDRSKYADPTSYREWFERQTGESADEWEDGYPIRNHNTTTIAPTGTTSMIGNTTGGCEPIYNVAYYKNVTDDVQGDEMLVEFDDYFLRVLEANDIDVEEVKLEARDQMANNEFDGVAGLESVPDAIGELFVTTGDLSAREHAAVQCACQAGVDSAISKTVNAPHDSTAEDAREVFEYIYDNGGKGVTYYRDGTRSKQVLTTRADNKASAEDVDVAALAREAIEEGEIDAEDLLEEISVDIADVDVSAESEPVTVGAGEFEPRPRPDTITGATQKIQTGYGGLYVTINEDEEGLFEVFATIGKSGGYTASFTESIARLVSLCLRSGVPPERVVEQLEGIRSPKPTFDRGEQIHSVPDAVAKAMRRYIEGDVAPRQSQLPVDEAEDDVEAEAEAGPETRTDGAGTVSPDAAGAGAGTASDVQAIVDEGRNPECPDCGSMLVYVEGCVKCNDCGYSEC
ncbi:MAG: adenosylcobalamin-dependent ribonucleoside-diphosphate reductase [Halobacteriales archaeon]